MPPMCYPASTHFKMCFNTLLSGFLPETSDVVLLHVIYQDVTESKAGYIRGRGVREAEAHTRKYSRIYYFFVNFRADELTIQTSFKSMV